MTYHQDWLMRQLQQMIEALFRILLGWEPGVTQTQDANWDALQEILEQEGICAAEDALMEGLDSDRNAWMEAGLLFYERINRLSDAQLAAQNFSRQEILEGLKTFQEGLYF